MAKTRKAGDLETEAGFPDGVRQSHHRDAEATVIVHEESVAGVAQAVRRILKLNPAPTALMVVRPYHFLGFGSRLAQDGIRVPDDMSIITRDDDPFLKCFVPVPARYVVNPHLMAKRLLRPVLELFEGNAVSQPVNTLRPEFLKSESIAPPP